jgi:hypothetical protein
MNNKSKTFNLALIIFLALIVQPLWPYSAGADMGRIYATDAKVSEDRQKDEVVKDMKKRCSLKPEKGPCKAIYWKYFFDPESKKCKEFIWGGCDGVVPFETEADCKELCEEAEGKAKKMQPETHGNNVPEMVIILLL